MMRKLITTIFFYHSFGGKHKLNGDHSYILFAKTKNKFYLLFVGFYIEISQAL